MATLTKEESTRGIRVSEMTPELQDQVEKLGIDQDGDGKITMKEMETLIESYLDTKKDNKFLRHLVTVLVIFSILLTGCVFGASITAARLSKDTVVDPVNGIMYAKGSETPIQTEAVAIRNDGVIVNDMNRKELDALHEISLDNGSMKFQVKGYAKSVQKNQVTLLVEGGSLIYGQEGLVAATGMAETMFNLVYPDDDDTVSVEEGVRRTQRVLGQAKTNTVSGYADAGSPIVCLENYNPVLCEGCEGNMKYSNQCFATAEGFSESQCTDEDPTTPSICSTTFAPVFCKGIKYDNLCVATEAGFMESHCTDEDPTMPIMCTNNIVPVFCEGIKYDNLCFATAAGLMESQCTDKEPMYGW